MTDTTFVDKTTQIVSSWLNDVNVTVYRALGSGGVAPTTAAAVRTNLSVYSHADLIAAAGAGYIGFDQSSTYPAGTVGLSLQRFVNVLDAPYNADPTGATDSTAAIQAAITALEAAGYGGIVFLPRGTYKTTATLTIAKATWLIGEYDATLLNCTAVSVAAVTFGSSQTVWNGYHGGILNMRLNGASGGNSSCHGILINAKLTTIGLCTFTGFKGSGIRGYFAQYTQIERCGFSGMGRYSVEITTSDYSSYLSSNVLAKDLFQNDSNILGGVFFQGANSRFEEIVVTTSTVSTCTDAMFNLQGYNNVVANSTFEVTGQTGITLASVTATSVFQQTNEFKNCFFESDSSNTPIALATLTGLKISDCTFNLSPPTAYVMRTDTEGTVTYAVLFGGKNTRSDTAKAWLNARQNAWFSDAQDAYLQSVATTSGSYLYTSVIGAGVILPCWGVWEITVRSGHTASMSTNCGVQTFWAYYLPGISTFDTIGTFHGAGTVTVSQIVTSGVASTGQVTVSTTSSSNAAVNQIVTAKQIGFSE